VRIRQSALVGCSGKSVDLIGRVRRLFWHACCPVWGHFSNISILTRPLTASPIIPFDKWNPEWRERAARSILLTDSGRRTSTQRGFYAAAEISNKVMAETDYG
jgi:hypothetical protein